MIRVVIDTNVLISGTFWDSPSFKVLDLVDTNKVSLIVSREILDEYDDVLHRDEILDKSAYSFERAQSTIKMLGNSVIVEPLEKLKLVKDDPDDDIFIETAIAGSAEYIITQDNHLLKLKEFKGIKIVTPEEFLSTNKPIS